MHEVAALADAYLPATQSMQAAEDSAVALNFPSTHAEVPEAAPV
jgi:hypothetical protein